MHFRAVKQEIRLSEEAARRLGPDAAKQGTQAPKFYGLTVEEAKKILDLNEQKIKPEDIEKRYKFLYELNSRDKANSPYLQSKIYQAKECLRKELK